MVVKKKQPKRKMVKIQINKNVKNSNSQKIRIKASTETILSMINKHKTQLVQKSTRKSDLDVGAQVSSESAHRTHENYYDESDSDDHETNDNLFSNTNVQDAIARDKQIKDKIAEVSHIVLAWNIKKIDGFNF